MKRLIPLLISLLLTLPAAAELPSLVKAAASASGTTVRNVVITVTVTNRGKEATEPAAVVITCTPSVSGRSKGEKTLRDPIDLGKVIGPLEPGKSLTFTLDTPYQSANDIKSRSGAFRANNVDPTGEKNVNFKGKVVPAPRR